MTKMIAALILALIAAPALAKDYTEDQLSLASQLGAVLALSGTCPTVDTPVEGIARALTDVGLGLSEVTEKTPFRARMEEQAATMNAIKAVRMQMGTSKADVEADACRNLRELYGPDGTVRPGIIPGD
jgi:hypothetical protein